MVREVQIFHDPEARFPYAIRIRHDDGRYEHIEAYKDPKVAERKAAEHAEHSDVPVDLRLTEHTVYEFGGFQ